MKLFSNIYILFLFLSATSIYLSGCASTGAPTGGPKDSKPPVMDSLLSTQNKQRNFRPKVLTFHFDEFVEVKDPIKQVLISPPLTYIPAVKHKGKKVTFAFDEKEILRDNATYTINFGESIVDFHEGNKLNNFSFVFATGNELDSLNLKGKIINAQTGEPETEMVVFLYDNTQDSTVRKEKPFYFAKPDKTGLYEFRNIKSDTFRLFAIKDENLNYLYDLETEKIAYSDSLIILNDSFISEIVLYASLPVPAIKILNFNTKTYGKINILCNTTPPDDITYTVSNSDISIFKEVVNDSINLYYQTEVDSFFVYLLNDTIKVKPKGREDLIKKSKFRRLSANNSPQMLPKDSLVIGFNMPIGSLDIDKILLYDTIGQLENISYTYSKDLKKVVVKYPWVAGEKYTMEIDSGLIKSIYGQAHDSIGLVFSILTQEKTAAMKTIINDLDSMYTYVINILREKTQVYQQIISGTSKSELLFKGLVPDRYNIEIIRDENKNLTWDAGNYWEKKQPEQYKLIKGDKLRENRETELIISWKTGTISGNEPIQGQPGLQNNKIQQPNRQ